MKERYERMLSDLRQQGDSSKAELEREYRQQINDLKTQLEELNIKMSSLRNEYEDKIKTITEEYEERIKKIKDGSTGEVAKMKADYENQIKKLKEEFEKVKQALIEDHKRELEALRQKMEKEKEDALAKLTQTNEKMLKTMNDNFKKTLDKTKKDHENKINSLKDEHAAAIQERQDEEARLLAEIERLNQELKGINAEKDRLQGLIDVEVAARKEAESRIQAAIDRMNHTVQEYDLKTKTLEREYAAKESKLKQDLKNEMDRLIKEHVDDMETLQMDFSRTQELMDEKYNQLEERYNEIQSLYDNRPSRPEDLEIIKRLQQDIDQKDNLLKKAAEDMKFYKLELINRENSYNKMFGSNPNVGVMNPLTATKK